MTIFTAGDSVRVSIAGVAALGVLCAGVLDSSPARAADLAGVWSGGGSVVLANGTREKSHCRVTYTKASSKLFAMSAACATASVKVSQTATLKKSGPNSYSGTFFNPEYGVSGQIRVTVKGKRQYVLLSGDAGRGAFSLQKR
ncbi:MAG: hypothetical protein NW216_00810 [Hyphomicrobium sp.]|nr:hypothetical protein [Hyphomicrobium sp.]